MKTRIEDLLVAMLGVILGILVFSGVAKAGEREVGGVTYTYPDVWLVSPQAVELPATIVIASPEPDARIGQCVQGSKNPQGPGVIPVEYCEVYLVNRSGPDSSGHYLSEWRLPIARPGLLTALKPFVGNEYIGQYTTFLLTVTGNAFQYGDYRSCLIKRSGRTRTRNPREMGTPLSQGYVAYYARVSTAITFQVERKVRLNGRWRWQVVKRYKSQVFPVGGEKGLTPYTRRYAKQNVPRELLYPSRSGAPTHRLGYLVKQGRKTVKRGTVSEQPCQSHAQPPYITP